MTRRHCRERAIAGSLIPQTLHRTLGWTPSAVEDGGRRYNRRNKLRARLALVDEASMATPNNRRLIRGPTK